jgi:hypothetical protein
MKTKLNITIEIDEPIRDTIDLFNILYENGECKISDIFNPDSKAVLISTSGIRTPRQMQTLQHTINEKTKKDHIITDVKFLMSKRK